MILTLEQTDSNFLILITRSFWVIRGPCEAPRATAVTAGLGHLLRAAFPG